jgi:hypothetical protein
MVGRLLTALSLGRTEMTHEWLDDPRNEDGLSEDLDFADPGGRSALRAASKRNPRNLPCPTCGAKNRLTPRDRALGYQCDSCADRIERGYD